MCDSEVRLLLSEWDLEEYIPVFERNKINTLSMALLQSREISELIPEIGPRAIFLKNFDAWRQLMHPAQENTPVNVGQIIDIDEELQEGKDVSFSLSEIFNVASASSIILASKQNTSQNNKIDTNESKLVSNEEKNLETLLNSTLTGKVLLAIEKDEPLTNPQRLNLVKIIGNNILQSSPADHVKASTYVEWAQSICKFFKKESPSVYFHIKYMVTPRGVINRCCGKLPDQIGNLKRKYRQSGIIPKKVRNSRSSSCSSTRTLSLTPSASEYDETDENLTWLKNSSDPWMTVEEKWQSTTKARFGKLPIEQYFQQYPALQKPHGYSLLKSDFDFLYAEKTANLTDTFPLVKEKIFGLAARKNSKDKYIQTLLSLSKSAEEISNLAGILLIPSLLSVSTVHIKHSTKKVWRPSKAEVREGFVHHVTSEPVMWSDISARRTKFSDYNLTLQPFIIIVGPSLGEIHSFFVVINNITYKLPTILSAVDACFKIIWAVNAQYPLECHSTWMFIQRALYKLETPHDKASTSANILLSELGLE